MQPTPRRRRVVTEARAPSKVSESGRGLAPRLSPTHTDPKNGLASALAAKLSISATLVTPKKTPRCGKVKPIIVPVRFVIGRLELRRASFHRGRPLADLHTGDQREPVSLGLEDRRFAFLDLEPILAERVEDVRLVRDD